MGGMAVGYAVGGRVAARLPRPMRVYGFAEVAMALWGLVACHLLPGLAGEAAWVGAAALILPCTLLAGFTLPVLVEATRGPLGGALGHLYAVNTAGAVVGTLATGLFAVGALGLNGAAWALATLGGATGLAAVVLGGQGSARSIGPGPPISAGRGPRLPLALALVAGAAAIAEEVLWTRALLPHLNSSTYAFSVILAVFLAGLAGGAACAGAALRRRPQAALPWLVATQLAAAALVLLSPELLRLAEVTVPGYVGVRRATGLAAWLGVVGVSLARAALALLPPTLALGFAVPLLAQLHAGDGGERGAAAGRVSAWNTVGAVGGALAARFVLLPALGIGVSLQVAAALHVGVAALAARGLPRRRAAWGLAVAFALGVALRPPAAPFLGRLVAPHKVLMVDEGAQDTTAVAELTFPGVAGARQIFSNGIAYAGDTPGGKRYMRLLGHLPALAAAQRRRALVVCVGTGMTAAAVARHEAFERIDLVDISPAVTRTLPWFRRSNDGVWEDPRARLHIVDGRRFVAGAEAGGYDIVTLEPPPPRAAGVAALYSREFYVAARRLLAPGGALAQWLPMHGMTEAEMRMLARTFLAVFPQGSLVRIKDNEAALLGIAGDGASADEMARRASEVAVAEHLASVGVADPAALARASGAALVAALGPGPLVTDDHPRVEHFAADLGWDGPGDDEARRRFAVAIFGADPQP